MKKQKRSFALAGTLLACAFSLIIVGCGGSTQIQPPTITSVTVSPKTANVQVAATQPFTATVTGTGDFSKSVDWAVVGGASNGTISASGLYTAPASVPNPATVTITATAVGNNQKSDSATVTVTPSVVTGVAVTPPTANVQVTATQQFAAQVNGSGNPSQSVTWVVVGGASNGTISASGLYTAPASVPNPATVTITATSVQDPTKSGNATVTVKISSWTVSGYIPAGFIADQGVGVIVSADSKTVMVADNPKWNSTDSGAGMIAFDSKGNLLGSWNSQQVISKVNRLIYDSAKNVVFAAGWTTSTLTGGSCSTTTPCGWLAEFAVPKGAGNFLPVWQVTFQVQDAQNVLHTTKVSDMREANGKLYLLADSDSFICWPGGSCANDALFTSDLAGNIQNMFPVGNTQQIIVGHPTLSASLAVDSSAAWVGGFDPDAQGNPNGTVFFESFTLTGSLNTNPGVFGPGVESWLYAESTSGTLYDVETSLLSQTSSNILMSLTDKTTGSQDSRSGSGMGWNGDNNSPTSMNIALDTFVDNNGDLVTVGTLSDINNPSTFDAGGIAINIACPSTCTTTVVWQQRLTSVLLWNSATQDAAGNYYFIGRGTDNKTLVLSKNP